MTAVSTSILARLRTLSLQSRFMLTFGSVVVTLILVVMVFASQRQSRTAMDQIEKRAIVIAQSLSTVSTPALLTYDYSTLQRLADEIRAETSSVYVIIHDKESAVGGFSGRPDLQWSHLEDLEAQHALTAEGRHVHLHSGLPTGMPPDVSGSILEVSMPVHTNDSPTRWGTVRVGLSLAEVRTEVAATTRDLAFVGLFAVAVVLVSARFFTSRITAPLRELAEATARVADGHLDQTVDEDLVGELGEAARSFNKMTEDLRRSRDALRYQKQHLENMVQERTAALRQKARELERANRELKEVDRLKSDFLSNVSHELRTPLTSIRSFTEILADGENVSEDESSEFLGIIAGQTDRLTRLIGDLLDLSKIEAGEFHCNLDTLPLASMVIGPALETTRRLAEDDSITITEHIEPDLPEIYADGDRLSQVTMNLIGNAVKFTGSGGEISVRAYTSTSRVPADTVSGPFCGVESDTPESGVYVIVAVSDTGCGIALEDQQRIFEKFGQVGNILTSKPQGTGLGLAISANIIIQHRGALWVRSTTEEGSTFYYSIPVSGANSQIQPVDHRRIKPRQASRPDMIDALVKALDETSKGTRAMVIDDNPSRIQLVTAALEPLGYRAMGCEGGQRAVERARDLNPDVIVLSAHMADLNGYDVLRGLKQDPRTADVPVIMIGPAEEMTKAYELGAAMHIEKQKIHEPELALRS